MMYGTKPRLLVIGYDENLFEVNGNARSSELARIQDQRLQVQVDLYIGMNTRV